MATRQVLAELVAAYAQQSADPVHIESVGGVDAARRVQAGEAFDVVILASDAIDKLAASGHVRAGSKVDLVHSGVAVAVREGAPVPDLTSEDAVRRAVLAARSLSYSTGPSGVALARLFERWGIAQEIAPRIVQAPPGRCQSPSRSPPRSRARWPQPPPSPRPRRRCWRSWRHHRQRWPNAARAWSPLSRAPT